MHNEKLKIWTEFPLQVKETPNTQKQLCPQYSSNTIVFNKMFKHLINPNIQFKTTIKTKISKII